MNGTADKEIESSFDIENVDETKKILVSFLANSPYKVEAKNAETQKDVYFDTDDFMFYQAHESLRIRQSKDDFEACIKTFAATSDTDAGQLVQRTELSEPVKGNDVASLLKLTKDVGIRLQLRPPNSNLKRLFELTTQREKILLHDPANLFLELALDQTTLGSDQKTVFCRLEIECKEPSLRKKADAFIKDLVAHFQKNKKPLKRSARSKFMEGFVHKKFQVDERDFGKVALSDKMSEEDYAHGVLGKYLSLAFKNEAGVRIGDDPEFVHQMRVNLRKTVTAMSVFRKFLNPIIKNERNYLKDLASKLGEIRDLDVQISSARTWNTMPIDDKGGSQELIRLLNQKREQKRRIVIDFFDSDPYQKHIDQFEKELKKINTTPTKKPSSNILSVYKKLVDKRIKKFRKQGDSLNLNAKADEFHRLRILGKKLRYALEYLEPVYGTKIKNALDLMSQIQDDLGLINDYRVFNETLADVINKKSFSQPALFEIGQASMHYSSLEKDKRKELLDRYKGINWKDFDLS